MPDKQAKAREAAVARELADNSARLRLAMDAGRMAVWDVDFDSGQLTGTPELNRLLDFPEDHHPTIEEVRERYRPGESPRIRDIAREAMARGDRYFEVEFRYAWRDGTERWMQLRAEILDSEKGRARHMLGVILDITERKASEERLKLLMREVDHRANNLLTVLLAAIKLSRAPTVEALKTSLEGRIAALAHVHSLLSSSRWEGADLRRLVAEELKPYLMDGGGQASLAGPEVSLRAEAAQSIAMVLHELATNAMKYGALSNRKGEVAVTWATTPDGDLHLSWAETCARKVKPPKGRGFGIGMVERALKQFRGRARFDWRREGLVCEIDLPAERLA